MFVLKLQVIHLHSHLHRSEKESAGIKNIRLESQDVHDIGSQSRIYPKYPPESGIIRTRDLVKTRLPIISFSRKGFRSFRCSICGPFSHPLPTVFVDGRFILSFSFPATMQSQS